MWIFTVLSVHYFFLHLSYSTGDEEMLPRIAIVGAGLSGTSAAYFLRHLFGNMTQIDVYESGKVGGRASLVNINGHQYEAGASIIHEKNRYMVEFANKLSINDHLPRSTSIFGLCANSGIVFTTSDWQVMSLAKLFWRYGLDLYTLRDWTKNFVLNKFERIYSFQERGFAFTTVEDMLRGMSEDILNLTRYSLQDVLSNAGLSQRFIDELAMAAMRNNYGQMIDAHGFVGAVSLVGAEPGLWSVRGGNRKIAVSLLNESRATLIQAKVTSVVLMKDNLGTGRISYEVKYETGQSADTEVTSSQEYDIVIIATPIFATKHQISFLEFPYPVTSFSQDYHTTIAMFVQGRINASTFNLNSRSDFPSDLFTISPDLFFNSIGRQSPVNPDSETEKVLNTDHAVWKTFLNRVPTEEEINFLFDSHTDVRFVEWLAYPEYKANMGMPPFMLFDKLYYINAIESAAAAMEMNVIGSKNVALLAFNQWHGHLDKIDEVSHTASESHRSDL